MRTIWVERDIEAAPDVVWALLTEVDRWPEWGPTVARAQCEVDRLENGVTGTVTTVLGVSLPFEITDYEDLERWSWKVGGVRATDHRLEISGPDRCRVGFGVPALAWPYLVVCWVGLHRLAAVAAADHRR